MARQTLAAQQVTSSGLAAVYSAAHVDGHAVRLAKGVVVHVKNGSGSSVTATIATPGSVDGNAIADKSVAIPAGADRFIALGANPVYRQAGGVAHIDLSAQSSVTVAALAIP